MNFFSNGFNSGKGPKEKESPEIKRAKKAGLVKSQQRKIKPLPKRKELPWLFRRFSFLSK